MFNGRQPSAAIAFLWKGKLVIECTRQLHADLSMFTASLTKDEQLERKRSKKYGSYLLEATAVAHSFQVYRKQHQFRQINAIRICASVQFTLLENSNNLIVYNFYTILSPYHVVKISNQYRSNHRLGNSQLISRVYIDMIQVYVYIERTGGFAFEIIDILVGSFGINLRL